MFVSLFGKECKQILKSLVYYLYVLILALFLSTQLRDADWSEDVLKPESGWENYGMKESTDERDIMGQVLAKLVKETEWESFATYPFAFYKEVIPSSGELDEIKEILKNCTGKTWDELLKEEERHYEKYDLGDSEQSIEADMTYAVEPRENLSYEEFKKEMKKVADIIGKGSAYEEDGWRAEVPRTYEEALAEYKVLCKQDKITGAYMRLFCDYAGIMLALLPVFLGVTRCLRDKRADAVQVIYAKEASSAKIILSRYLANVFMAFLPVVVIAFLIQLPYCYHAKTLGVAPDYLAFLTYPVIWLLPEIMVVMSLAFFLTETTDRILAVFVQTFWGIGDILAADSLLGNFGMHLSARWNTVGETSSYLIQRGALYRNRIIYAGIAVILILFTVVVYEKKRKEGESLYGKIFRNRPSLS